jgi:uncharacterized membrane protein
MTLEPWLLFFHIAGAIVWIGGGIVLSVLAMRARAADDPVVVAAFAGSLSYIGLRVFAPSVIAVIVTGAWLVLVSPAWDFAQLWVLLGLTGFGIAFLVGAAYLGRVGIELERVGAGPNGDTARARELMGRWIVGYRLVLVVLVLTVWDMVFKPGL